VKGVPNFFFPNLKIASANISAIGCTSKISAVEGVISFWLSPFFYSAEITNTPSGFEADAYTRSDSNAAAGLLGGGVPGFTP
jgi:hypothetical protein